MSCICIYVQPSPALQCYVESELLSMLHWLGRSENAARTLKGEEQLEGAWPEHWRPNKRSRSPAGAVRVEVRLGEGPNIEGRATARRGMARALETEPEVDVTGGGRPGGGPSGGGHGCPSGRRHCC